MKIGHAINFGEDSDSAVLSYIEGLLSEASADADIEADAQSSALASADAKVTGADDSADDHAQLDLQGINNKNSSEVTSALTPDFSSSAHGRIQQAIPVVGAAANARPAKGELEEGKQLTANNPFLKQLEAAQRRGRSAVLPGNATRVDNRPLWGRQDFSCLSFKVSGLKLAIPVHFIEGMQPLDLRGAQSVAALVAPVKSDCAATFADNGLAAGDENPAIILGQMTVNRPDQPSLQVDVVDTARLVMPERYDVGMLESYRYVLIIKNCDWCIAVDSIGGELALGPQNVRWRSEHTRREWLAGTVVDKMCALVDIDVINRQILAEQVLNCDD